MPTRHKSIAEYVEVALDAVDTAVDVTWDAVEVAYDAVEVAVEVARGPKAQRPARMGIVLGMCMAACAGLPADGRVASPSHQALLADDDLDDDLDGRAGFARTDDVAPVALTSSTEDVQSAIDALDTLTADGADLGERIVLGFDRLREATNRMAYAARSGAYTTLVPMVPDPARADFGVLAVEPVAGTDSSGFGTREDPINGRIKFHAGIDFRADRGTPVMAAGPGKVIKAGRQHGYGNIIIIDHGMGLTTRYAHLSKINAREGDFVSAGDLVGLVGASGRATGPHLHFEVRQDGEPINPYLAMQLAEESRGNADVHLADSARWLSDPKTAAAIAIAAAVRPTL